MVSFKYLIAADFGFQLKKPQRKQLKQLLVNYNVRRNGL